MTVRTELMSCPYCGRAHDAATGLRDRDDNPSDKDISICIGCGEVGQFKAFDTGMQIVKMTERDMAALDFSTRYVVKAESAKIKAIPAGAKPVLLDLRKPGQEADLHVFGVPKS